MNQSAVEPVNVLVRLSGHRRGKSEHLHSDHIHAVLSGQGHLDLAEELATHHGRPMATFKRHGADYSVNAAAGSTVWVNGEPTEAPRTLVSGDVIEVGDQRHVLRYRQYPPGSAGYKSMQEAFSDCAACAKHSDSFLDRLGIFVLGILYEMATQIRPALRVLLLAGFTVAVGALAWLWYQNFELQQQVNREIVRIEELSTGLRTEGESFTRTDFRQAQEQYGDQLATTVARLEVLERRLGARSRVIADASNSVLFLQSAYGFVDSDSGKPLRVVVDENGNPVGAFGHTETSVEGTGPVFELFTTGTGFVVSEDGLIATNRHVTQPWEADANSRVVLEGGYTAVMLRFVGYLPGVEESFEVEFIGKHPDADLALLRCREIGGRVPPLSVSREPPQIGDEVVVLGYPTGMRALIARVDPDYIDVLLKEGAVGFWDLAERLSSGGYIRPLATAGVVGQISADSIVYDAETTHGGSGGPVLDLNGAVIAVNTAIIPEFGGSNIGVPSGRLRTLLDSHR
jgi:serine protease Do